MGWSASIRVMDSDGDPKSNAKVSIHFSSHTSLNILPGGHLTEYTDSNGWAYFSLEDGKSSYILDAIYVDGNKVSGSVTVSSGDTKSYTI